MKNKLIFLWSTRRTLSMAFHRSIYQLSGIKHFCEPFALPHYFGPHKRSVQFSKNPEVGERFGQIPTHEERVKEITAEFKDCHTTFVKEHAMYAWPDIIPREIMEQSFHTFIIRNPEKAIKSVYRQTLYDFEESVWSHIVPEELGFKEQLLMYDHVTKVLNKDAFIVDADDLIESPKEVLESYCKFVGLPFEQSMLDWSNEAHKTQDKPWDFLPNSWIKDVKETNGFRKVEKKQDAGVDYPEFIYDAIAENMQYYDILSKHKIKIEVDLTQHRVQI